MTDAPIPPAAIEAAAKAMASLSKEPLSLDDEHYWKVKAKDALQAAAPFMREQWEIEEPPAWKVLRDGAYVDGQADGIEAAAKELEEALRGTLLDGSRHSLAARVRALADRKPEVNE